MRKKIIFGVFIALCLIGGIYWFTYTKQVSTHAANGMNAIPADAALIIECNQSNATWKKLSQTNIMWEELLGTESFSKLNKQILYLDSLMALNSNVSSLLDGHSLFVSVHPEKTNYEALFVFSLPNLTYRSELESFMEKANNNHPPANRNFENTEISSIHPAGKPFFYFSFVNGILMMSSSEKLIENSITQFLSGKSITADKHFTKITETAGKRVDANVYLSYKMFSPLLQPFVAADHKNALNELNHFADYSGWDVSIKPNSLMLSGFSFSNDSIPGNYLNLFAKQKPQKIEIANVLPSKTAFLLFYGISNMKLFRADYKKYKQAENRIEEENHFIESTNAKYSIDIESSMTKWIDNEMALAVTESADKNISENTYAIFHSNNINDAIASLNELSDSIRTKDEEKYDTTSFRLHPINHFRCPNLLFRLFGQQFRTIQNNYFSPVGDYIVFANSEKALQNYITEFENNKILSNDKNYISFAENISKETNLFIYSAITRSTELYKLFVKESYHANIDKQLELLHKFEACGIQFTYLSKLFYSNIYLKYNPSFKQETSTLWESKLDTTLSSKPYLLTNHNTKAKEVFVQDDANKIYLISNTGKIIWTKQLNEKIMSDVIQVDVLKNDKLQLIFNTNTTIYMFDRNGNDMKGFPVKLKSPATNAISVFDYEKTRDYRIFIACENEKVLCYDAFGKLVEGFKFDKTANPVYIPVQYFTVNNNDHLCIIDVKGKVYILDRKGNTRVKMKEQTAAGIHNYFIESGKDYTKTFIIASDTLGNTIKLSLSGDKEKVKFQDFETSPYFEYRDINNDKTKEFIYLTRNELKVFNADKTLLFKYEFTSKISQAPLYYVFPDGTGKIGINSELTNELFLFNNNGSLYEGFPLRGKTGFSIGDLNNDGTFNIISGSADNSIYVYQIQ